MMRTRDGISPRHQVQALGVSTFAFTVCFAVWTVFSIIGIRIKQDLGLNDTEFGILVATPILTGSLRGRRSSGPRPAGFRSPSPSTGAARRGR